MIASKVTTFNFVTLLEGRGFAAGSTPEANGREADVWHYDVAAEAGACDAPHEMPPEQIPESIRRIRRIKKSIGIT